ncbi:MAG: hypothetical protein ABSB87_07100 [Terriglobales bacterium]|jgi:hypothetical protein
MKMILVALLCLASSFPALGQNNPKILALTSESNISVKDILALLPKECPSVSIVNDVAKSDYMLEAIKRKGRGGFLNKLFDLTLFDREGGIFIASSNDNLRDSVKDVCHAIKTSVLVEVVDTQTLTQSRDARGDTSGGAVAAAVNATTGRRTHTDTSTISVIVNGEHALLDCYERRTGCTTIAPGKYYGQLDGGSIWVNYEMPLTHKPVRNHYKIAGSW